MTVKKENRIEGIPNVVVTRLRRITNSVTVREIEESLHDLRLWSIYKSRLMTWFEGMVNFLELLIPLYLFIYLFVYLPKFIAHLRNLNFYASFLVYLCLLSQVALLLKIFLQVTFTVMHISFVNSKGYFDWQKS